MMSLGFASLLLLSLTLIGIGLSSFVGLDSKSNLLITSDENVSIAGDAVLVNGMDVFATLTLHSRLHAFSTSGSVFSASPNKRSTKPINISASRSVV
jgi:hypothetical protein